MPAWLERSPSAEVALAPAAPVSRDTLEIGLVNNMPDAALDSTERQFLDLLDGAAGDLPVRVRLYTLPHLPRSAAGRQHLSGYHDLEELLSGRLDGLIVTGTEPRAASLIDEPYWRSLSTLIDWTLENTACTIWSCLAAHAAVLQLDGIGRVALPHKRFGMLDCVRTSEHLLTDGLARRIRVPHSRCNELSEEALVSCGYEVLTRSPDAGVDAFMRRGSSLHVFFQGHPEYDERALLREYRRDVARFLRAELDTYPAAPTGYFADVALNVLTAYREIAHQQRNEALLADFPTALLERSLIPVNRAAVKGIYHNWLLYLRARKADRQPIQAGVPRRVGAASEAVPGIG
ncbi:MAG: homoserine O-succinyltransferase [Hyphomicrobiales bacterium]|nr:homoserine O-succinyltransferase [Hyphomicrobiales bacterium]